MYLSTLTCLTTCLSRRASFQQVMAYHNVFVYGTLKTGEPNHHWFKKENGYFKLIGNGTMVEKYPLIIGTKYNIPFLLNSPGNGRNVVGEVYEVDEKMIANLDILEEYPKLYGREVLQVKLSSSDSIVDCWIYLLINFRPELLLQTCYESYSSMGDHGLKYAERYLRDPAHPVRNQVLAQNEMNL